MGSLLPGRLFLQHHEHQPQKAATEYRPYIDADGHQEICIGPVIQFEKDAGSQQEGSHYQQGNKDFFHSRNGIVMN